MRNIKILKGNINEINELIPKHIKIIENIRLRSILVQWIQDHIKVVAGILKV